MNEEELRALRPMAMEPVKKGKIASRKCGECECCKAWRQIFGISKHNHANNMTELRKIAAYWKRQYETLSTAKKRIGG